MTDQQSFSLEFTISERSFPRVCTKMIFKQGKEPIELKLRLHDKDKTARTFPRERGAIAFVNLLLQYKLRHAGASGDFEFYPIRRGTIESSAYDVIDKQGWVDAGLGCDHKQIFTLSPKNGGLSIRIRGSVLPPEKIQVLRDGKKRPLNNRDTGKLLGYLENCWKTIRNSPNSLPGKEKEGVVPTDCQILESIFLPPWAIESTEDRIRAFNTDLMFPMMERCEELAAAAHDSELQFQLLVYVAGCLHLDEQHAKAADYANRARLVGLSLPNSSVVTASEAVLNEIARGRQDESKL